MFRRYFAESAATLACMVFGVRDGLGADGASTRDYWITDGVAQHVLCLPACLPSINPCAKAHACLVCLLSMVSS